MNSVLFLLSLALGFCVASVDFTRSTLYDIEDFRKQAEVRIPKCDNGCLIFASTMGNGFVDSPSDYDPYAEKLMIYDSQLDRNLSITDLSRMYDERTSQKTPMTIMGPTSVSVLNLNDPAANNTAWPIVLYVVENSKDLSFTYEIYDGLKMKGIVVSAGTTTVMCAFPFSLAALKSESLNSVTARLVGFDNALDGNGDECPVAYSSQMQDQFTGFVLNIDGPIISLITEKAGVQIDASLQFPPESDLSINAFITTGGFNGCRKPQSGGFQSFRSPLLLSSVSAVYTLDSNTDKYDVTLDFLPNLDYNHTVSVYDVKNQDRRETIKGHDEMSVFFDDTDYLQIIYSGLNGDQGFLLRYSSVALPRPSTTTETTTTTTSAPASTSTTETPTTSSSRGMQDALLIAIAAFSAVRIM